MFTINISPLTFDFHLMALKSTDTDLMKHSIYVDDRNSTIRTSIEILNIA
jgi:hypothetical protein